MKLNKVSIQVLIVTLIAISAIGISCKHSTSSKEAKRKIDTVGTARIKFDTTYYDFGTLVQGEQISYTFKFKNIGTADLLIFDAYATCGCTVPRFSKEPIGPGETGKVEVLFDSSGKRGVQYKSVRLKLNTVQQERTLDVKANVIEK